MNQSIAEHNFQIFTNLEPYQKLIVDSQNKVTIDERWVQSARRTITGDSRVDIVEPIENTFTYAIENNFVDVEKTLEHLSTTLDVTYPDFEAVQKLIRRLLKRKRERDTEEQARDTGRKLSNMLYMKNFQNSNY